MLTHNLLVLCAALAVVAAGPLAPTRLQVMNFPASALPAGRVLTVDPAALHALKFSWSIGHTVRGQTQTAARVVVAANAAMTAVVWDSGLQPQQATFMRYNGTAVNAASDCWFTVQWADSNGGCSRLRLFYFST